MVDAPVAHARIDHLVDPTMIGLEDRLPPRIGLLRRDALVAGNDRGFADGRNRARDIRRPVAVDHQPRIALRDQMRTERVRTSLGDTGNPDIPGDMPREFAVGQAEIAKRIRDQSPVVIAGQQEGRGAGGVALDDGRNWIASNA